MQPRKMLADATRALTTGLLLLALGDVHADWKPIGPSGGMIAPLYRTGKTVYVAGAAGLWKSADAGATWNCVAPGFHPVSFVASGTRLFATGPAGVYRSSDQGATWSQVLHAATSQDSADWIYSGSLVSLGHFVIAGSKQNLFRSGDSGDTWAHVNDLSARLGDTVPNWQINQLAVQGGNLYGVTSQGLFRSADSGSTGSWTYLWSGPQPPPQTYPPRPPPFPIMSSITPLGRLLFGSSGSLTYRSSDNGKTWEDWSSHLTAYLTSIVADGSGLYAASDSSLFHSKDSGDTWARVGGMADYFSFIARGDTLFAGTQGLGGFRSTDGGKHFAPASPAAMEITNFAIGANRLFIGTHWGHHGVYATGDKGATWSNITPDYDRTDAVSALAVRGDSIFAFAQNNWLWISHDGGADWKQNTTIYTQGSSPMKDAIATEMGIVASDRGCVLISRDGGSTWPCVQNLAGTLASSDDPADLLLAGKYVYLADRSGFYRSEDGGLDWTSPQANPPGPFLALAESGDGLYAAGKTGVYRSPDHGDSWTLVDGNHRRFTTLASSGAILFAASDTDGVFVSADQGANWTAVNQGLGVTTRVTALAIMDQSLYAGTYGASVWSRPLAELIPTRLLPGPQGLSGPGDIRVVRGASGPALLISVKAPARIRLELRDLRGKAWLLADGFRQPGEWELPLSDRSRAPGIYFLRFEVGGISRAIKIPL